MKCRFARVPPRAAKDVRLGRRHWQILTYLCGCADENDQAWPKQKTIAAEIGIPAKHVCEAIRELSGMGYIGRERGCTKRGRRVTCYTILYDESEPENIPVAGSSRRREVPGDGIQNIPEEGGSNIPQAGGSNIPQAGGVPNTPSEQTKEQEREARAGARSPPSPRGHRLPEDWRPSEPDIAFAKREIPDLDVEREINRFRDYWIATAGAKARKADWGRTWRNWIRRDADSRRGPHGADDMESAFRKVEADIIAFGGAR